MEFYHDPVMKEEVLQYLQVEPGKTIVDCTLGGGGHSEAILQQLAGSGQLVAFDRDPEALAHATHRLDEFKNKSLIHSEFSHLGSHIKSGTVDGILCDLGISSRHVDNGERGFSFKNSETIDLRMNPNDPIDATRWILETPESLISQCLSRNADLKKSHRMAKALVGLANKYASSQIPMADLMQSIAVLYPEKRKDHGTLAARILQALRMEINAELSEIRNVVTAGEKVLKKGGRMVFLTYHSVEDRLVKQLFRSLEETDDVPRNIPINPKDVKAPIFIKVVRKFLAPTPEEIQKNPRARSAKMRVYERV